MKAIVTFDDEDDQVKISIDFGPDGAQELNVSHQAAVMAVHLFQQHVKIMNGGFGNEQLPPH